MIDKSALGAALLLAAATVAACGGGSRRSDPGDSTTTSAGEVGTVELDTAQRSRIHVEKVAPETYTASVTTTGTVAFNGDRSTRSSRRSRARSRGFSSRPGQGRTGPAARDRVVSRLRRGGGVLPEGRGRLAERDPHHHARRAVVRQRRAGPARARPGPDRPRGSHRGSGSGAVAAPIARSWRFGHRRDSRRQAGLGERRAPSGRRSPGRWSRSLSPRGNSSRRGPPHPLQSPISRPCGSWPTCSRATSARSAAARRHWSRPMRRRTPCPAGWTTSPIWWTRPPRPPPCVWWCRTRRGCCGGTCSSG